MTFCETNVIEGNNLLLQRHLHHGDLQLRTKLLPVRNIRAGKDQLQHFGPKESKGLISQKKQLTRAIVKEEVPDKVSETA